MILPRTYIMTSERLSCYRKEAVLTKKKQARDLDLGLVTLLLLLTLTINVKIFTVKRKYFYIIDEDFLEMLHRTYFLTFNCELLFKFR